MLYFAKVIKKVRCNKSWLCFVHIVLYMSHSHSDQRY